MVSVLQDLTVGEDPRSTAAQGHQDLWKRPFASNPRYHSRIKTFMPDTHAYCNTRLIRNALIFRSPVPTLRKCCMYMQSCMNK